MNDATEQMGLTRREFVAAAFGAAALAALGTTGCTSDRPSSGEQISSVQTVQEATRPAVLSAVLDTEDTAVIARDAFFAVTPATAMLKRHLFEGLYEIDPHTGKVSACLAVGLPTTVNATTYDVELREDAAFSDGSPVLAAHVVGAYAEMIARSNTFSSLLAPIATVTATGARTVRIILTAEEPAFLSQRLSLIDVWAEGQPVEGAAGGGRLGSGPWAWTADLPDDVCASQMASAPTVSSEDEATVSPSACAAQPSLPTVSFVPNPHYTGSSPATAQAMSWSFTPDASERMAAFTGGWSLVCADASVDGTTILEDRDNTVEYVPGSFSPYLMFNCAKPPFDDAAMRQAMLYAIDYDRLISQCFNGHAVAPTSPLPLSHANYHRAATVYSHDTARARHLLERKGIAPDTPASFSLAVCGERLRPLAETIAEDLAETGVNVTVEVTDETGLAERSTLFDMALCADDPALLGPDCDLFLTWRYGGDIVPECYAAWSASEAAAQVMENLRLARATTDASQQQKLWNECFDLIAEEAPLYPLCFCEIPTAWRVSDLAGFAPLGTGCIDFLGVSLR